MLLNPELVLKLRPLKYPKFYNFYEVAIKNHWSVDEVDFKEDIQHLSTLTPGEQKLINRIVAFFATADSLVGNNIATALYKHINAPEARMYLSRAIFEEALHVEFYLTLLDSYVKDINEREKLFDAVKNMPSIKAKADFCLEFTDSMFSIDKLVSKDDRRSFLKNLLAFALGVEGMFFFGAFAYVYYFRSRGLLPGLASGTNWVFRDESLHMDFAKEVFLTAVSEEPDLFDDDFKKWVVSMVTRAIEVEYEFAKDALSLGVSGISPEKMLAYLRNVGDQRLASIGLQPVFGDKNPLEFMVFQNVMEHTNFFERRVSAYQSSVSGEVCFSYDF